MDELVEQEIKFHVLIVEDDLALANGLCRALKSEGTETVSCHTLREAGVLLREEADDAENAEDAVKKTLRPGFDLIILDVNLPDGSGFDFLQKIKKESDIYVIMLTANDMETDIVAGLEAGADDYITKPFSLAVLRARVAAQLRRAQARQGDKAAADKSEDGLKEKTSAGQSEMTDDGWIFDGDYRFHFAKMLFYHGADQIELSKSEQKLLHFLVENRGITLARDRLLDCIWSVDAEFVDENTLSVTVKRLRDKLGSLG